MKRAIISVVFFLFSGSAFATGVYIGGGVGMGYLGLESSAGSGATTEENETDLTVQVFGGWQFHENIGVEVSAGDLGSYSATSSYLTYWAKETFDVKGAAVSAVGFIPLGRSAFSLVGKAGLGYWSIENARTGNTGTDWSRKESGITPVLSFGGQFSLEHFLVRAQIESYVAVGKSDTTGTGAVEILGVSAGYRF